MTSADATLALGQQQAQSGNYQAAAETFKCVLAEEPKNLSARVSLAHVYSYLGRYEEAEKIFIEVIESEPDRLDLRITLAQLYAHIDRRAEAIARFREVIEIDPVDSDAWAGIVNLALSGAAPAKHDLGEVAGQSGAAAVSDERRQTYRERRRLILADRLHALLDDTDKFVLLDAGARDVQDDPRWRGLPDNKMKTYAFEPDKAECERLTQEAKDQGRDVRFFPVGLWSSEATMTFECNKTGGGSSFLHQNRLITDRWKFENPAHAVHARDIFFPVQEEPITVTRLESWARENGVPSIDFMKLNVQGGELEILRGAGPLLDGSLGLLVEVGFVESYESRPFFSDIDRFLRDRGFVFFDLLAHHYVGRAAAPIVAQHLSSTTAALGQLISSWGQLIEGHALYLRDPIGAPPQDAPNHIIKLICIAEIFGQVEYAFELLDWLTTHCRDRRQGVLARQLDTIMTDAAADYRTLM